MNPTLLIERGDVFITRRDWLPRALWLMAAVLVALAVAGVYLRHRPLTFDPARWQSSTGHERGRMLKSLLTQTDFVGFTRAEVQVYLGAADFDERLFWYDLGSETNDTPIDPRADVGNPQRLYGVFRHDRNGMINEVLYNHRRPIVGSELFDSSGWFGEDRTQRRAMFTRALGRLRALGLTQRITQDFLGPPDGVRVRGQYDVGGGGAFFGGQKALILEYDADDVVSFSFVTD